VNGDRHGVLKVNVILGKSMRSAKTKIILPEIIMTWAMELGAIKDKVPKQKEILNAPRLQVIKRNTCCCSSVV